MSAALLANDGKVDISKLKGTLSTISSLGGKKDPTAAWPNTMGYQILKVDASMIDEQVALKANLDNMSFAIQGSLDQDTSRINLNGTVTIAQASEDQLIQVDPMLVDLPLPFYCKGSTTEPDCGPDTKRQAQSLAI